MKIEAGSRWVIAGDSITDAGRDPMGEPTPWNRSTGLGNGYVAYAQALLDVSLPERRVRMINRGVSGNTVLDLAARWQADVLAMEPDWLTVLIGINDVWRQFDTPLRTEVHVGLERYEATYRTMLQEVRARLRGLVLMAPFVIDPNPEDGMRRRMLEYGAVVRRLAGETGAEFVDTQAVFDRLMGHIPPTELAWDRIHPGPTGHMAIARAMLAAVGWP